MSLASFPTEPASGIPAACCSEAENPLAGLRDERANPKQTENPHEVEDSLQLNAGNFNAERTGESKMSVPILSLAGKVALVTGGSRGIGESIALMYAEAGADVAICSRRVEDGKLEGVARRIRELGRRCVAIQADTSRKTDVDRMVERVLVELGGLDILVNNAGILVRSSLLDISEADLDRLLGIDLKAYILCAQAAGKVMVKQQGGVIINISTQHAFKASPGFGAYGVAKAGVVMLTRVLARELGSHGIRTNSIAPGLTRTEFSELTWKNTKLLKEIEAGLPLGRMGEPVEVAEVALFLASDASRYVTGQTIVMEGGGLA
jgi:NAD(P)-dependent dehydrogenase (short-subunit alcohol dehydrogenase family)